MQAPPLTAALQEAKRKVGASTRGLAQLVPSSGPSAGPVPATPAGLADILAALLAQLKMTTTTLALAFKPPLSPAAIQPYADKLEDQVARAVSCVLALAGAAPPNAGSSALVDVWRKGVTGIGETTEGFLAVLEEGTKQGAVVKEGQQSPYLAHTGLVHTMIDRLAANLPRDEGAAVCSVWEGQKGTVLDAWDEFKELLEDDEEDEDDFGDDLDDEWGILEAPMGKLSAGERKRAEAVSTGASSKDAHRAFGQEQADHRPSQSSASTRSYMPPSRASSLSSCSRPKSRTPTSSPLVKRWSRRSTTPWPHSTPRRMRGRSTPRWTR